MKYRIAERGIGRAGNFAEIRIKQQWWDLQYGKDNWVTGYEINGQFIERSEAINEVYNKSYFHYLDYAPRVIKEIQNYGGVFNPHALFTSSVDLQAVAIIAYFKENGLEFKGPKNKLLPIGIWQPKKNKKEIFKLAAEMGVENDGKKLLYERVSYLLSPYKVRYINDKKMSIEKFWQSKAKCLAVKSVRKTKVIKKIKEILCRHCYIDMAKSPSIFCDDCKSLLSKGVVYL